MKNVYKVGAVVLAALSPMVAYAEANYVQKTTIDSGDGNTWVDGVRVSIGGSTQFVIVGEKGLNRDNVFNSDERVAWAENTFGVGFDDRQEVGGYLFDAGPDGLFDTPDDTKER